MNDININQLLGEIRNYADEFKGEIEQGRESPQLAARSIRNYGYGMAKASEILVNARLAVTIIFETDRLADQVDDS